MFTGIIKKISIVESVSKKNGGLIAVVKIPSKWKVWEGESIAINGICSTLKKINKIGFTVEYMPETIKKTTAGSFKKGTFVNLEKSLKMNDLLDGHIVQGHVDGVGRISKIIKAGDSLIFKITILKKFMKFIAEKGSISVDGISLTVVDTGINWFTVSLVSYTLENTNLGKLKEGDYVNIETDVLAKYVAKLLNK